MYIFLMMLKHASLGFQHNFPFQNWFNFEHVEAFQNLSIFPSVCLPTTICKIIGPNCTVGSNKFTYWAFQPFLKSIF